MIPRTHAITVASAFKSEYLKGIQFHELMLAGSIRRDVPEVKDIELVAYPFSARELRAHLDALLNQKVISKANYAAPGKKPIYRWGEKQRGFLYQQLRFELFLGDSNNFGYQLWLRTGPAKANTKVMHIIKHRAPFRFEDGYAWSGSQKLSIRTENQVFTLLGMHYVQPSKRSVDLYRRQLLRDNHVWGFAPLADPDPADQQQMQLL